MATRCARTLEPLLAGLLLAAGALQGSAQERELPWLRREPTKPVVFPPLLATPSEAREGLAAGWVAVDVRSPEAFAEGHLPGAMRLPPDLGCSPPALACLQSALGAAGLAGAERLLVYGDGADLSGLASVHWRLRWAGVGEVKLLAEGFGSWRAAGHPTETGAGARPATRFSAAPQPVTVDAAWLAEHFGTPGTEVVDLRGETAWSGQAADAARPGHVPHSLPYDFGRLLAAAPGTLPPAAEARRQLGRLGPRKGTYVDLEAVFVVYGDGPDDPRLGQAFLLLTWMGVEPRLYLGGWREWPADPGRPVVRIADEADVERLLAAENPGLARDSPPLGVGLLDVRGEPDFAAAHLPGARNLPSHLCGDQLIATLGDPPRNRPIVFYCYGSDCVRSRQCSTAAARQGFTNLLWFREGMPAWSAAGLPVFPGPSQAGGAAPPVPR